MVAIIGLNFGNNLRYSRGSFAPVSIIDHMMIDRLEGCFYRTAACERPTDAHGRLHTDGRIVCRQTDIGTPVIGPIPWDHSGTLCHALSLSSSLLWTSMRRRRATMAACDSSDTWRMAMRRAAARSGEWAQHFSNASCFIVKAGVYVFDKGFWYAESILQHDKLDLA